MFVDVDFNSIDSIIQQIILILSIFDFALQSCHSHKQRFIGICSCAFTILISLIRLIRFFFDCNMSSFEKFDYDAENFKLSLKSNHKIQLVDDENGISFNVKFFIVEKLFENKTETLFDRIKLLLKELWLFEKKNKKRERFF